MAKIIDFMKKKKLFSTLVITGLIGIILGGIFLLFLNDSSIEIMGSSINTYFNNIKSNSIKYSNNFIVGLVNSFSIGIIIWLLGISMVGGVFIILIFGIKCFMVSLSFFSIIYLYGINGILLSIIYIIPYFINMLLLFILSYYAISFSILIFKYFFRGVSYNRKVIIKRYIKILGLCLIGFLITTLIDVFLVPKILLLF